MLPPRKKSAIASHRKVQGCYGVLGGGQGAVFSSGFNRFWMIGCPMFQTNPHRLKSCFPCWKWCFPHDFQVFNYYLWVFEHWYKLIKLLHFLGRYHYFLSHFGRMILYLFFWHLLNYMTSIQRGAVHNFEAYIQVSACLVGWNVSFFPRMFIRKIENLRHDGAWLTL